jgi:biotin carboxyl carrier protein
MAPEVSGRIVQLPVADNQFVHKGDLLMVIDPTNYKIAVSLAEAAVQQALVNAQNAERQAKRRLQLSNLAVTVEQQQTFETSAVAAQAQYQQAVANLNQAWVNLERTEIRSPVNGWVTNLLAQLGDYANVGQNEISLVDADSFWVDGYFEETGLDRIRVGDPAEIKLMRYPQILRGHVGSIARGINPIFTWVRLAQRVPVRIHIDQVPGRCGALSRDDGSGADRSPFMRGCRFLGAEDRRTEVVAWLRGLGLSMALCRLPAGERLMRFRHCRVHDLLVHSGVGGQFDDVTVWIAKIDRPAEAVVDRPAHFEPPRAPLLEHAVEHFVVDAERDMQVEAVLSLEIEELVWRLEERKAGTVIHLEERVQRISAADLEGGDQWQSQKILVPGPRLLGIPAAIRVVMQSLNVVHLSLHSGCSEEDADVLGSGGASGSMKMRRLISPRSVSTSSCMSPFIGRLPGPRAAAARAASLRHRPSRSCR